MAVYRYAEVFENTKHVKRNAARPQDTWLDLLPADALESNNMAWI